LRTRPTSEWERFKRYARLASTFADLYKRYRDDDVVREFVFAVFKECLVFYGVV